MIDPYIQQVLRVIVAQICQTIGWHSIQTTPLELLVDTLHKYLHEITRNIIRYTVLYNRIEPNLNDVGLTFRELNINLQEIEEYVNYVQPIPCNLDVTKFRVSKELNLNFLKPESKEVITRPIYIPEHLPPIFPERENEILHKSRKLCDSPMNNITEIDSNKTEGTNIVSTNIITQNSEFNRDETQSNNENENNLNIIDQTNDNLEENKKFDKINIAASEIIGIEKMYHSLKKNELNFGFKPQSVILPTIEPSNPTLIVPTGRPTREIMSVMMTSSGFISPACEGKLPDFKIPSITEPYMRNTPSPISSTASTQKLTADQKQYLSNTVNAVNFQTKHGYDNMTKSETKNVKEPNMFQTINNISGKNIKSTQFSSFDSKYLKKLKRKNLVALEKEQRKLEKSNKINTSSKQLLPKQQQKLFKQQHKQLLKIQKQHKEQNLHQNIVSKFFANSVNTINSVSLESVVSNSDIIMPTSVILKDARATKIAKRQKNLSRKRDFYNIMQLKSKDKNLSKDDSCFDSINNLKNYDKISFVNSYKDSGCKDSQRKKQILIDSISKSTSIIAQQQTFVAQVNAENNSTAELSSSMFNKTTIFSPKFPCSPTHASLSVSLPTKNIGADISIRNECDRTKFCVFKNSQKGKDVDTQTLHVDKFIHLPSGTTITPATDHVNTTSSKFPINVQSNTKPGITTSQIRTPNETDQIIFIDDDDNNNTKNKLISKFEDAMSNSSIKQNQDIKTINNVKNNSISNHGLSSSILMMSPINNHHSTKREKLMKRKQQNEPLNLSNDKLVNPVVTVPSNIGSNSIVSEKKNGLQEIYLEQQKRIQQQYAIATKMMKKERKKPKLKESKKNVQTNVNQNQSSAAAAVLAAAHQQYIQNLAVVAAVASSNSASSIVSKSKDVTAPTVRPNENLAAINKELFKIETVIEPTQTLEPNSTLNSSQSSINSGNASHKSQKSNQSSLSKTANALVSLGFPYPPFPYPFPSRPGLIPAPGIFPHLTNIPNTTLVDKFLPMMPFSKLNTLKIKNTSLNDTNNINSDDVLQLTSVTNNSQQQQQILDIEKNYCNVAPFVPESMIGSIKLSPTKLNKFYKHKPPCSGNKETIQSKDGEKNLKDMQNYVNDVTIEISDDEKNKSDTEEKLNNKPIAYLNNNQHSQLYQLIADESISNFERNLSDSFPPALMSPAKKFDDSDHISSFDQSGFPNTNNTSSSEQLNVPSNIIYTTGNLLKSDHVEKKQHVSLNLIEGTECSELLMQKHERRKDHHKKNKKTKDGKIKKKKDKKEKLKNKDKSEKRRDKDERIKEKEKLKKQKKEKKKEKLRQLSFGSATSLTSVGSSVYVHDCATNFDIQSKQLKESGSNDDNSTVSAINYDNSLIDNNIDNIENTNSVPKLTLKLGIGKSPTPESIENSRKFVNKTNETENVRMNKISDGDLLEQQIYKREFSPELARISPLVTRPPKQKSKEKDKISDSESASSIGLVNHQTKSVSSGNSTYQNLNMSTNTTPLAPINVARGPGRPKGSGSKQSISHSNIAVTSSSVKGQYLNEITSLLSNETYAEIGGIIGSTPLTSLTSTLTANSSRPTNISSADGDGNQVWICPACGRVDDGTPMIGCDGCDAWYHWVCVGIQVPPDDSEDWYCRVCIAKKQATHDSDKKKKRKKKNKQTST